MIVINKSNVSIGNHQILGENSPGIELPTGQQIPKENLQNSANNQKKSKDKMLKRRYELKYRIPEAKARAIAKYVEDYIPVDKFSKDKEDYEYPISSLYLDSHTLDLYNETIDKKVNRFKLRVRCYDDNSESPCFFEIKRRFNSVIVKDRARAEKKDLADILLNGCFVPCQLDKDCEETLKQFQFYARMINSRPIVLVRYIRQAFEGSSSSRVRITFDRKLSYKMVNSPELVVGGGGWQMVPMDFVVLEIKFSDNYPSWLSDMVKIFDLKQTSMSKYCSTVKQSFALGCNSF